MSKIYRFSISLTQMGYELDANVIHKLRLDKSRGHIYVYNLFVNNKIQAYMFVKDRYYKLEIGSVWKKSNFGA